VKRKDADYQPNVVLITVSVMFALKEGYVHFGSNLFLVLLQMLDSAGTLLPANELKEKFEPEGCEHLTHLPSFSVEIRLKKGSNIA